MQPMVQPSDSEQSPSEEAVLGFLEISQQATEEIEAHADEDYFNSMQNLKITEREAVQISSESSQAVVSGTESTEAAVEEMESEEPTIPYELAGEATSCRELIEANKVNIEAEREEMQMFEEMCLTLPGQR